LQEVITVDTAVVTKRCNTYKTMLTNAQKGQYGKENYLGFKDDADKSAY